MNLGIMQGRVTPSTLDRLQIFPSDPYGEFLTISDLGFDCVECLDDKNGVFRDCLRTDSFGFYERIKNAGLESTSVCADRLCDFSLINNSELFLSELDVLLSLLPERKTVVVPFFDNNFIDTEDDLHYCVTVLKDFQDTTHHILSLEVNMSASSISSVLKKTGSIGICYDTGNRMEYSDISQEIYLLRDFINHIHIKDKCNNSNLRIRDSNDSMNSACRAIEDIGYDGPLIFETCILPVPLEEAETNLATMKKYIGGKK